ncbi:MAG: AraC family transcriptional regulator [Oscillospiraceae bacterium]|nr:AraC family transcriptional regulator [Oscillospiraceae bacterium]
MQPIRIIEIPGCKMVSSGAGMFGEDKIDNFAKWFSSLPRTVHSRDYLTDSYTESTDEIYEKGEFNGMLWYYEYTDGMDVPEEYEIVDFKGGLYAVATDIDQKTDVKKMKKAVNKFLKAIGFIPDKSRPELGNIITSEAAQKVLGYEQMDYYTPVKALK